jgi:hypothetical protein
LTRYFCPECGSPLYTVSPVHPDVLYLKAGTLDDPRLVQPRHQNWMQSRVSWTTIDPELPALPKIRKVGLELAAITFLTA